MIARAKFIYRKPPQIIVQFIQPLSQPKGREPIVERLGAHSRHLEAPTIRANKFGLIARKFIY